MEKGESEFVEVENKEWIESLDNVFQNEGPERVRDLLNQLQTRADKYGVK